jgi:hypothetical protein
MRCYDREFHDVDIINFYGFITVLFFNSSELLGFMGLTEVNMQSAVFWVATPCSSETPRRFEGTYHLRFNGKISAEQETNRIIWKAQLITGLLFGLLLDPEVSRMFVRNVDLFPDYTALQCENRAPKPNYVLIP